MEKYIDIYNKIEDCKIKAKIFYTEEQSKKVFVFCHGFCSGKESNSVKVVADRLLELGITSIAFDFPGHGESYGKSENLRVDVCISYINSVVEYVKETYGEDVKISFYAISFGAYILLNKLINDKYEYENIVLRSPAFNMKEILVESLLKESFEEYEKNGVAKAGYGGKIVVTYSFYEDLKNHNIYNDYKGKKKILILQGKDDDTAFIEDTYRFIKDRKEIELIELENVKHHMSPEEISKSTEIMLNKIKK